MSSNVGGRDDDTPAASAEPGPHPLTVALVEALRGGKGAQRVLLLGAGSGRNVPALLGAGFLVDIVEERESVAAAIARRFGTEPNLRVAHARYDDPTPFATGFDAALSTHALLHGTPAIIEVAVAAIHAALRPQGRLFATFGSQRDPRFGAGRSVAPDTFAPYLGSEAGVAHAYFDERGARALLARFAIEEIVDMPSGTVVGRWAHDEAEAEGIVHWWVRARRNQ